MLPNVPQSGGAQKRVHHRVNQHIRIRMALQSQLKGNLHPA